MYQLKIERCCLANTTNCTQILDRCRKHSRQGSEARQQSLGQWFHVAAGKTAEEVEFQRFVIMQRSEAAVGHSLAQPFTVAKMVRLGRLGRWDQQKLPAPGLLDFAAARHDSAPGGLASDNVPELFRNGKAPPRG